MKAHLRSARIAPKKANIIAQMVRGMPVNDALKALKHTHKKGARMVEELLKSAVANAEHNDKQDAGRLVIKTIIVNQSVGYRRGIPKARGSVRPITKFLSHISVTLGLVGADEKPAKASQSAKNTVKKSPKKNSAKKDSSADSSISSDSSTSS